MSAPGSGMTSQQHANAVRDALQNAADRMNEAKAAGVIVQFELSAGSDGKMCVNRFMAYNEMKLNN